jgi:pimeloyl-ACP methyl ester carboxylesterase
VFIGNSVGGFAVARLAITDPQRVSRLVMVNAGGFVTNPVRLYCRVMRPHADRLTAPCLIIWGSKDTAAPMRLAARATAAAIPGSRLEALPTGHVAFYSDPDGFLAIAAPFLAAASGRRQ